MIYDAAALPLPAILKADLCVVGSGPGGGMVATLAAESGLKVLLLEAGSFLTPADMTQREEDMLPKLFWESGARATADRGVYIHQGKGVGGSTLHNINLCKRIPDTLLRQWDLEQLQPAAWHALYRKVETLLQISEIPVSRRNRHNQLLETACQNLNWRGGPLHHNRTGCIGSGFCELGCAYDGKNNVLKQLIPRAVKAGAEILTHCQATRLLFAQGRVTGLQAVALDPFRHRPLGEIAIETPRICLSASATGTAALLLRSKVPHLPGTIGQTLRIHPGVVVAGEFEQPIRAWEGIPQSYECTEFLEFEAPPAGKPQRLWILPAFAHPMATATLLPGHGSFHRGMMERYAHMAVLSAMLHDNTAGSVEPKGDLGLTLHYRPEKADAAELRFGLQACARLLLAAGARRVIIPSYPILEIRRLSDLTQLDTFQITPETLSLTAVHPMGTVPMGNDPQGFAVDSTGRSTTLAGLWIADGSLFPTSIGVPPQVSIYALGLHVGQKLIESL